MVEVNNNSPPGGIKYNTTLLNMRNLIRSPRMVMMFTPLQIKKRIKLTNFSLNSWEKSRFFILFILIK